jgi:PAS domain S-box-containing protein
MGAGQQALHWGIAGTEALLRNEIAALDRLVADALDQSDDIVVILERTGSTADGILVAGTNDAFCRMSGYSSDVVIGRPFLMLADEAGDPAVQQAVVTAVANATSLHTELLCKRRDGSTFWFGFHIMPTGELTEFGSFSVVLGRDITARLKAGEEQKAMQELLASVFTAVDAAVAIISEDGRFLMTNPKLMPLFGYSSEHLAGKPSTDLVADRSRDVVVRAQQQQLTDGKPYTIAVHARRRDGSEFPARLTSAMINGRRRRFGVVTLTPSAEPEMPARIQVAGKLQLVGLTEVKSALGSRWDGMVARVMQTAEHILRRRLGPRDEFSRTSDHGFLVCFAELSEQEAAFRAAMIAREIRNKLVGQGEEPAATIVSAVTTSLPLDAGATPPSNVLAQMMEERLKANLATIHGEARQALQKAVHELRAIVEPVIGGNGSEVVAIYADLPEQKENRVYAALAALPQEESSDFDLDALRLTLAAECCARTALQGAVGPVFVTLGFEAFNTRAKTDRYVAVLSNLDQSLQRRLNLMFAQLPPGLPTSRLLDCIQRVRPYCRGIGFEIDELRIPSSLPNGIVLVASADDWSDLPYNQLTRVLATTHAGNNRMLVRHVASRDAAMALRTLGVDLISMRR